jgi:hypothetical protein
MGLTKVLQPVLDGIRKVTGMNLMLCGGLEYDDTDGDVQDHINIM